MANPNRISGFTRITSTNLTPGSGVDTILSPLVFGILYNLEPQVLPNTADNAVLNASGAVLEFTGTDPDANPIVYQVDICKVASFGHPAGDRNMPSSPTGIIHPNPSATLGWDGNYLIDDRPGQCFAVDLTGKIVSVTVMFNKDADTNGTAYVKIYDFDTATTYGSTGAPVGARPYTTAPTPDWIAISDGFFIDTSDTSGQSNRTFTFSGANQVELEGGKKYVLVIDWWPVNSLYNNTITVQADTMSPVHPGNMYQDGNGSASINNGPQAGWDLYFSVTLEVVIASFSSDVDLGFANVITPSDTSPFNSGEKVSYTKAGLAEDVTWYWRVSGKDPAGTNTWGGRSTVRAYTVEATSGITANLNVGLDGTALAADGAVEITGQASIGLDGAALSAAASVDVSGEAQINLTGTTLAADAAVLAVGSLNVALADTGLSSAGVVEITASLVINLADATLTADAVLLVSGSLDAQMEDAALDSSVTVGYAPNGADLTETFEDTALSAESLVLVSGGLAVTLADATVSTFGRVGQVSGIQLDLVARGLDMQLDERPRGFVLKNRNRRFHGSSED